MGSSAFDQSSKYKGKHHRDRRTNTVCDWNSVQSQLVVEAIRVVSRSGGALRFGLTRDQGAFAVGIYGEDQPYTEYFHSAEDCANFLREIVRDYSDDTESGSKIGV